MRWIIELHRLLPGGWVTLQDVYRCTVDAGLPGVRYLPVDREDQGRARPQFELGVADPDRLSGFDCSANGGGGWGRNAGSSPELCVKVRGSSSMLGLGCLGDLLGLEE